MGTDQMDDYDPTESAYEEEDQAERSDRFPLGE